MEKFQLIAKPEGMPEVEQEAYVLAAGSIAGATGNIYECQVMMLVHPDFADNAEVFREKIEKFFDNLFKTAIQ